jgi:peroxiredoxin/outer membrane lipoprotein-sorting protein
MLRFIPLALFLLLPSQAAAQIDDAAGKLLQAVGARYTDLESFHFEAVEVTRTRSGTFEKSTRTRVVTALDRRGRSRVEFDDGTSGGITVFDGETTWVYFPHLKKYGKFSGTTQGADDLGKARGMDFAAVAQRYTGRYRGAGIGLMAAKAVRTEAIEAGGRSFDCQVIEAQYETPQGVKDGKVLRTYWVDPESRLILREQSSASMKPPNLDTPVEVRQVIEFRQAQVATDLPDALFIFQPPAGTEQIDSAALERPASEDLVGKPAPDFTLRDLAGDSIGLKQLRGQVVVLDFWATWCGPCRIDMPRIQALHDDLKSEGLRVFGVNGEDALIARAYLDRNGYTFPTLSDPGMSISRLYQVSAIPTAVVIDKEGKVGAYMQGSGTKERLLEAIEAAGLRGR